MSRSKHFHWFCSFFKKREKFSKETNFHLFSLNATETQLNEYLIAKWTSMIISMKIDFMWLKGIFNLILIYYYFRYRKKSRVERLFNFCTHFNIFQHYYISILFHWRIEMASKAESWKVKVEFEWVKRKKNRLKLLNSEHAFSQ